jgi:hypothetical protein
MVCSPPGESRTLVTPQCGPGRAGAPENFLVKNRPIQLIRRQTDLVAAAELAGLIKGCDFLVGKPESHPLFHEMGFIEMLRHSQDPSEKKRAHLDCRFANPAREAGRFFNHQEL